MLERYPWLGCIAPVAVSTGRRFFFNALPFVPVPCAFCPHAQGGLSMAFFKDNVIAPRDNAIPPRPVPVREPEHVATVSPPADTGRRTTTERAEPRPDAKESFIAADLTVDGKI